MALILLKHGEDKTIGRTILDLALPGDDLLLLQEGVLWSLKGAVVRELREQDVSVHVLQEDLEARGYTADSLEDVKQVNYDGVIALIEKNERIIS